MAHISSKVPCAILAGMLLALMTLSACGQRTASDTTTATPVPLNATDVSAGHRLSPTFIPSPTVRPITDVVPADTTRWASYHDQMFPFQMPIPPGWRYGTFIEDREGQTNCQEVVGLLPPGSTGVIADGFDEKTLEYFAVYVTITCPPYDPTGKPNDPALPSCVAIGGTSAPWYGRDDPTYGSQRTAIATFGSRSYEFTMVAPPSKARNDIALYLGMMKGFRYLG